MTATRIVRAATLAVGAALWLLAALLLWRTTVPSHLRLPHVDERAAFGTALVRRAGNYERFLVWDWLASTLAVLTAYIVMTRRARALAPRLALGPTNAGIVLGVVTLTVAWAATLPFGIAAAWWQRRHHISRQGYAASLGAAWARLLVVTLVALVVLAVVLGFAWWLGRRRWWLAAGPVLAGIVLLLQLLAPYLQTLGTMPLRSPELAAAVRTLERREHADDPPVRVEAVSGRTRVANAFATGVGPSERIVLWDTLLDGFRPGAVRVALAHELAHLARDHVLRAVGWFALLVLPVLALTALVADLRRPAAVPLALLVVAVAQLALLPLRNAISRRYEAEADWIALGASREPAAARALFRGFVERSLGDPSPPAWVHILLDDHPTALQRVELTEAWRATRRRLGAAAPRAGCVSLPASTTSNARPASPPAAPRRSDSTC
jgi:STE24 endopeptidase